MYSEHFITNRRVCFDFENLSKQCQRTKCKFTTFTTFRYLSIESNCQLLNHISNTSHRMKTMKFKIIVSVDLEFSNVLFIRTINDLNVFNTIVLDPARYE